MMVSVSSDRIIEELKKLNIKAIESEMFIDGSEITIQRFDDFLEVVSQYQVPFIYFSKTVLSQIDIEGSLITDEMIEENNFPEQLIPKIKVEVKKFNNKVMEFERYIGRDQQVKVVFPFHGTIFMYEEEDDSLYPDGSDDFIKSIELKFYEEIEDIRDNERAERSKNKRTFLESINRDILARTDFRKCTNETKRRIFASQFYEEHKDDLQSNAISLYDLLVEVNLLWSEHKDDFRRD
jgi:hypothetical protein